MLKIEGFEKFGKVQIDEFKTQLEKFKFEEHDDLVKRALTEIQKTVLIAVSKGKHVVIVNIDQCISDITNALEKYINAKSNVPIVNYRVPKLECNIEVSLDQEYIKGAVLAILNESFEIPVKVLPTEILEDTGRYMTDPASGYMEELKCHDCHGRRLGMGYSHFVKKPDGSKICKWCYLFSLISAEAREFSRQRLKNYIESPIKNLQVLIKIPK